MTKEMVLENLKKLIGEEFNEDDVICAFEDFEENEESNVYVGDSHNNGYDKIAYINIEDSTQFLFETSKAYENEFDLSNYTETIENVWIA